jgi:hypothetical protein
VAIGEVGPAIEKFRPSESSAVITVRQNTMNLKPVCHLIPDNCLFGRNDRVPGVELAKLPD